MVDDLDEIATTMQAAGIKMTKPRTIEGDRLAFIHDPSGNRIELHEAKPAH